MTFSYEKHNEAIKPEEMEEGILGDSGLVDPKFSPCEGVAKETQEQSSGVRRKRDTPGRCQVSVRGARCVVARVPQQPPPGAWPAGSSAFRGIPCASCGQRHTSGI